MKDQILRTFRRFVAKNIVCSLGKLLEIFVDILIFLKSIFISNPKFLIIPKGAS